MIISKSFEYGEPFIDNIYDLGVPEDAVVIDHRKTTEAENVLERLKSRIADFSHYVALMTQTELNDDGPSKDSCTLHLFAQDDDAWLDNRTRDADSRKQHFRQRNRIAYEYAAQQQDRHIV